MSKISIRFNKGRGQPGKGTVDHVWRVFSMDKEYLVKNFTLNVPSKGEKEQYSEDWNVVCYGILTFDKQTSTAIINPQ
jgi:hypothetical protein